ncbi:hypothetical protein SDC9_180524 [bioreactor metagenome]|uniref:Uncharacterized protein n=1 Tax=bioreactor metagenome TaxID=1076179 RepID=A0A645H1Z8_9ZZZZ
MRLREHGEDQQRHQRQERVIGHRTSQQQTLISHESLEHPQSESDRVADHVHHPVVLGSFLHGRVALAKHCLTGSPARYRPKPRASRSRAGWRWSPRCSTGRRFRSASGPACRPTRCRKGSAAPGSACVPSWP